VQNRRWLDPSEAADLGKLDIEAINAVKEEAWPQVGNAEELHDALVLCGFLTAEEGKNGDGSNGWEDYFGELVKENRATILKAAENGREFWVAAERSMEMKEIYTDAQFVPEVRIPQRLLKQPLSRAAALVEIIRGRLETLGPVRSSTIAETMGVSISTAEQTLIALENEGFVFRGHFTPGIEDLEWCERRLLARIHRYTLKSLRKEIEPVSAADFMRFLFYWHQLDSDDKPEGADALRQVLDKLEGFEAPAASWEGDLLPSRMKNYDHQWLDMLCLSGITVWGRFRQKNNESNGKKGSNPIKATPITLVSRTILDIWKRLRQPFNGALEYLSSPAKRAFELLTDRGACFFEDIVGKTGLLRVQAEEAMAELVAQGLVTSDSFTGLRALLVHSKYRTVRGRQKRSNVSFKIDGAGRWSLLHTNVQSEDDKRIDKESLATIARVLLRRYGVVFRKLMDRENSAPPWRELVRVLRTLEARGEIRGGRFVEGVWGEQFALPEVIGSLRSIRRTTKDGRLISISATDPLNLTGIITPGKRVSSFFNNRIVYKDGLPVAVKEGREVKFLSEFEKMEKWNIQTALIQRKISPKLRAYLGKGVV
ncbi:MAG: Lhr family helicase, partial [Thermodesulfobacteriota bacterium]